MTGGVPKKGEHVPCDRCVVSQCIIYVSVYLRSLCFVDFGTGTSP